MLLQQVSVRNYRIHRDLTLDLDPSRNLIGGPNESGKSTLIEAIHRALFLKASTGGAMQKGMVSEIHPGHPEVEVTFETGGKTYRISKRFSGSSGTATLTCEGESSLSGPEAEEKLAEVLGITDSVGGRMTPTVLAGRWSHLWVWQGSGGSNPSEYATQEKDTLLARLKDQGGGAVMQSDLDGRVAAAIGDLFSKNYTDKGSIRAHSPLDEAGKTFEEAREKFESARAEFDQLSDAVSIFENTTRVIQGNEEQITLINDQKSVAEKTITEADKLAQRVQVDRPAFEQKEKEYQSLVESDSVIEALRRKIEEREISSKEHSSLGKKLEQAALSYRAEFTKVIEENQALDESLREAGNRRDLASFYFRLKELTERQSHLKKKVGEISKLDSKRKIAGVELAKIPEIGTSILEELQDFSFSASEAESTLKAMATGIQVVESEESVVIGSDDIAEGDSIVIDEETQIKIGAGTLIQISPGGGTGLAEARLKEIESKQRFQEKLDRLGISSLSEARNHSAARQKLEMEIQSISSELTGKDADTVDEENTRTTRDIEGVRAEIDRRSKMLDAETVEPKDVAKARSEVAETLNLYKQIEEKCETVRQKRNSLERRVEQSEEQYAAHRKAFEGERQKLIELQTRLQVSEENHGNEKDRAEKLVNLKRSRDEAKKAYELTEASLRELEPEKQQGDVERYDRALTELLRQIGEAKERRAVSREKLNRDGTRDLHESLRQAEAEVEFAEEQLTSIRRKAEATKLLRETFAEEQRSLADQFTGPLVKTISAYLECVFGHGASAAIRLDDGTFQGLKLIRSGETFEFDSLSGGTREQVSAAVRLAMAEILLDENEGALPLVFDDAFANSDPERIRSLQRMLDLGACNGLQIILLSCDPTRYAGFGARTAVLG